MARSKHLIYLVLLESNRTSYITSDINTALILIYSILNVSRNGKL